MMGLGLGKLDDGGRGTQKEKRREEDPRETEVGWG